MSKDQEKNRRIIGGKLALMGTSHSDELYTPKCAFDALKPFLPKGKIIFECAEGTGKLTEFMKEDGFKVITSNDFFNDFPEYDIIVTNPPYTIKDKFLEEAYKRGKPFAMLMPITALEGQRRHKMYKKYGISVILPRKRTDFNGKGSVWFYTAWFCWGLELPNQINFEKVRT